MNPAPAHPTTGVVERVPAHDLKAGDTIMVTAAYGEYVGQIVAIETYGVFFMRDGKIANPNMQANGPVLCIRLPKLNTYRAQHDMVRLVERSVDPNPEATK